MTLVRLFDLLFTKDKVHMYGVCTPSASPGNRLNLNCKSRIMRENVLEESRTKKTSRPGRFYRVILYLTLPTYFNHPSLTVNPRIFSKEDCYFC